MKKEEWKAWTEGKTLYKPIKTVTRDIRINHIDLGYECKKNEEGLEVWQKDSIDYRNYNRIQSMISHETKKEMLCYDFLKRKAMKDFEKESLIENSFSDEYLKNEMAMVDSIYAINSYCNQLMDEINTENRREEMKKGLEKNVISMTERYDTTSDFKALADKKTDEEKIEGFYPMKLREDIQIKKDYKDGKDLFHDLVYSGGMSGICKSIIYTIANMTHVCTDNDGNPIMIKHEYMKDGKLQIIEEEKRVPIREADTCNTIIATGFHDQIFDDISQVIMAEIAFWLYDDNWKDYITTKEIGNGIYWVQFGTYVTPRSKRILSVRWKLVNKVRSTLRLYTNHRITDYGRFQMKEEESEEKILDRINELHGIYDTSLDMVHCTDILRGFIGYIKMKKKAKTANLLISIVYMRADEMTDKQIAQSLHISYDKMKNCSRTIKELRQMYTTERRHHGIARKKV